MKERPILFSGPMVRAILEGRKTQTRRVCGYPKLKVVHAVYPDGSADTNCIFEKGDQRIHCPHGGVGDRLWVRETLKVEDSDKGNDFEYLGQFIAYAADGQLRGWTHDEKECGVLYPFNHASVPSIHMPRWASRLTLELTEVRVERLQDISEADARSEGVQVRDVLYADEPYSAYSYVAQFALLWNSINGKKHPWESNPWVWVESFKVIE